MVRIAQVVLLVLLLVAGCSMLPTSGPVTAQHPAWAMNPADCAVLGTVVAPLLGLVPVASAASIFGAIVGKTLCQAESSLVAGAPPTITTTTTSTQTTAKPTS